MSDLNDIRLPLVGDIDYVKKMDEARGKGFPERVADRAKELISDPAMFLKHMKESADLKDHLNDFYDPNQYEDYKKHEANAEYVNKNNSYLNRFLIKQMSRMIACEERNKDKDNPKWRKDNNRCD